MNEPFHKVTEQLEQIRNALSDPKYKYHRERYQALGIPERTYYQRLERIVEEDTKDVEERRKKNLEGRTQRIKDALDLVSSINQEIMEDKEQKGADRIAASAAYLSAEYWIWRAEQAGPHLPQIAAFINKNQVKKDTIQISGPTEDTQ